MRWLAVLCCLFAITGCGGEELHVSSTASAIDVSLFALPSLPAGERAKIVRKYDAFDPHDLVPRGLLEDALIYLEHNGAHIPKRAYLVVVDLSLFSGQDRFWLVDLSSGAVEAHKVAHGSGSDPDHDGYATLFSNTPESNMSSLGFGLTAEIYDGNHPHSMRLDGLSPDGSPNGMANTKMRSRYIVVHEASYVDDDNTAKQGRSNGCLALDSAIERDVVDRIHGGSLVYVAKSALEVPVGRAVCGDGTCDGVETNSSCPVDCLGDEPVVPGGSDPGGSDPGSGDPGSGDPGSGDPGSNSDPGGVGSGTVAPGGRQGLSGESSLIGGCAVGRHGAPGPGLLLLWLAILLSRPATRSRTRT